MREEGRLEDGAFEAEARTHQTHRKKGSGLGFNMLKNWKGGLALVEDEHSRGAKVGVDVRGYVNRNVLPS